MRRLIPFLLAWPLAAAAAGELTTFELTDGSVITGELIAIDAGGYSVRSPSLGVVQIDQSDVQVMRRGPPLPAAADAAGAAGDAAGAADLAAMQQRLLGDPEVMSQILALQNDPTVRAAVADPAVLQALGSGNIEALQGNESLRRLLDLPAIRAIIERVEGH